MRKSSQNSISTRDTPAQSAMANTPTRIQSRGKWANLSKHACRIYFLIIILQVPLFRIQCRSGICTTPIHVTSSQLISSEVFPLPVVKSLLYPGAIVNGLITNMTVPNWGNLLSIYNLTDIKNASAVPDLQRLEVLAGSYFCVAGSLINLIKPGRMSMFGTLLIVWGLVKEGILGKPVNVDQTTTVFVYPTMLIALISALLSVKYDIKKAVKSVPAQSVAKPLKSSSKSKLK